MDIAPDITADEDVLHCEVLPGREPDTERTLRRLLDSLAWEDQRAQWAEVRPRR